MSDQLIYTGKAKDIYSTEDEHVIKSVYKDQATMLNGARKETIEGKGVLNNQISSLIFEKLNAAGVATHFIERISDTEQLNKKVTIIPLEVVLRNVTAVLFLNVLALKKVWTWRLQSLNFTTRMMSWMIHLSMMSM